MTSRGFGRPRGPTSLPRRGERSFASPVPRPAAPAGRAIDSGALADSAVDPSSDSSPDSPTDVGVADAGPADAGSAGAGSGSGSRRPVRTAAPRAPVVHTGPGTWVQLRNATFHPLLYRKMVGAADPAARPGDFVTVYHRDGSVFGRGYFNPRSQVALRLLSFGPDGPPEEQLLAERIAEAVTLRRDRLRLDAVTDAYRVVHAEGDGLSGLIVDRYGSVLVIELFSLGVYRRLELIRSLLREHFPGCTILVRADEKIEQIEGFRVGSPGRAERGGSGPRSEPNGSPARSEPNGSAARSEPNASPARSEPNASPPSDTEPPISSPRAQDRVIVSEYGTRFQVEFAGSHKTGFFCDQRDNRALLASHAAGADVLDLCSYTGGFGVTAAHRGRAASVTCVDLDEYAVGLVKRNANLNGVRVDAVQADSFPYLRQMFANGRRYDVVVLDPPKLVPRREDFDEGRAKYFDMNKLTLSVIKPSGLLLTCSCSGLVSEQDFANVVRGAARSAGRRVQILQFGGPGSDHPVMTECPESRYLKSLLCRVM